MKKKHSSWQLPSQGFGTFTEFLYNVTYGRFAPLKLCFASYSWEVALSEAEICLEGRGTIVILHTGFQPSHLFCLLSFALCLIPRHVIPLPRTIVTGDRSPFPAERGRRRGSPAGWMCCSECSCLESSSRPRAAAPGLHSSFHPFVGWGKGAWAILDPDYPPDFGVSFRWKRGAGSDVAPVLINSPRRCRTPQMGSFHTSSPSWKAHENVFPFPILCE